jgi:hypothetical protein
MRLAQTDVIGQAADTGRVSTKLPYFHYSDFEPENVEQNDSANVSPADGGVTTNGTGSNQDQNGRRTAKSGPKRTA